MKIREFKKAYAAQIAGGQKAFDNALIVAAVAVVAFSSLIWYIPNELNVYVKILGVAVIFFVGVLFGAFAQIVRDARSKSVITKKTSSVYFKYIALKAVSGFLIISALFASAIRLAILAV